MKIKIVYETIIENYKMLLFIMFICFLISTTYNLGFAENIYQAELSIYVADFTESADSTSLYNSMQAYNLIKNDYMEFLKSGIIAEEIYNRLQLLDEPSVKKMTKPEINNCITMTTEDETRVITISVKHTDRVVAVKIANTVGYVFKGKIYQIFKIDNINIINYARSPENPVYPKPLLSIIISSLTGLLLGFLFLYLKQIVTYSSVVAVEN